MQNESAKKNGNEIPKTETRSTGFGGWNSVLERTSRSVGGQSFNSITRKRRTFLNR